MARAHKDKNAAKKSIAEISSAKGVFSNSKIKDFVAALASHRHWDRETHSVLA